MSPPAPVRSTYIPGLDGLRAVAVVAVLLYHADMPWMPGGFLGVEVFFVISGYLITLLLTAEFRRTTSISATRFWLRRARRLLAALYALLAVVSVAVLAFYREEAHHLAAQVWAALGYVTNWYLIFSDQSYFATIERPLVFQHLWSLAIEEQFYLVWPLLLLGLLRVVRGRPHAAAAVVVAGAMASVVWMAILYQPAVDPSRVYYGTDTRASGLLFGAAVALIWRPGAAGPGGRDAMAEFKSTTLDLAGMAAVAGLVVCFARIHEFDSFLYRGGFAVVALATAVVIMATVHPATVLGRWVLAHPVLTWIGLRSYSLYLWHWPIFVMTRPEIDVPWGLYPTLVLRLGLTVIAAELSYRYIEVPIRNGAFTRWRRRLARRTGGRRVAGPILLASATAVLLIAVNASDTGAPPDARAAVVAAAKGAGTPPPMSAGNSGPSTIVGAMDTVTVLSDSVLLGAQAAITEDLGAAGYTVDFRASPALMVHQASDQLAAAGTPVGYTVIVGLGHNSLWERNRASFDDWAERFDREADELLDTLRQLGARRIVWVTLGEPAASVVPPLGREQYAQYVWYFPYVNERLHALADRDPVLRLADWAAVSDAAGLTYDAMHLTADGIALMLDTIRASARI